MSTRGGYYSSKSVTVTTCHKPHSSLFIPSMKQDMKLNWMSLSMKQEKQKFVLWTSMKITTCETPQPYQQRRSLSHCLLESIKPIKTQFHHPVMQKVFSNVCIFPSSSQVMLLPSQEFRALRLKFKNIIPTFNLGIPSNMEVDKRFNLGHWWYLVIQCFFICFTEKEKKSSTVSVHFKIVMSNNSLKIMSTSFYLYFLSPIKKLWGKSYI